MSDRTYWHVPGARSWHASTVDVWSWGEGREGHFLPSVCGRNNAILDGSLSLTETADRVPPNAHLCGSCARVIAARTDVEAA